MKTRLNVQPENILLWIGMAMLLSAAALAPAKETENSTKEPPPKVEQSKIDGQPGEIGQSIRDEKHPTAPRPDSIRIQPRPPVLPDPPRKIIISPVPSFDVRVWTDSPIYDAGETVRIYFRATSDAYVYIFDTDTAGVTRQIFPNYFDRDNFARGRATYSIPDRSYSLVVEGPSGRERLEAVAVSRRSHSIDHYGEFRTDTPYPLRKEGANGLLRSLEPEDSRASDSVAPQTRQGGAISTSPVERETLRDTNGVRDDRVGADIKRKTDESSSLKIVPLPHREIVISPPYPTPTLTARDETTFMVRTRSAWYEPSPDRRIGKLKISSDPKYAEIYIGGQFIGSTNKNVDLPFGYYEIRLEKKGYYTEIKRVYVNSSHDRPEVEFTLHAVRR